MVSWGLLSSCPAGHQALAMPLRPSVLLSPLPCHLLTPGLRYPLGLPPDLLHQDLHLGRSPVARVPPMFKKRMYHWVASSGTREALKPATESPVRTQGFVTVADTDEELQTSRVPVGLWVPVRNCNEISLKMEIKI